MMLHLSLQPCQRRTQRLAAVIAEAVHQHEISQKAYKLMHHVPTTLCNMLLDSSNEIYWRHMHQTTILYSSHTVRELLDHMEMMYGSFTEAERRDVAARCDVPWEGEPLEAVIQQIKEASNGYLRLRWRSAHYRAKRRQTL